MREFRAGVKGACGSWLALRENVLLKRGTDSPS